MPPLGAPLVGPQIQHIITNVVNQAQHVAEIRLNFNQFNGNVNTGLNNVIGQVVQSINAPFVGLAGGPPQNINDVLAQSLEQFLASGQATQGTPVT